MRRPPRMMIALIFGEHSLPVCSWRQPAANSFWLRRLNRIPARSASCRTLQAGSLRSPEELRPSRCDSSAQIEDGHSDGETVSDLVENNALQAIGDLAV